MHQCRIAAETLLANLFAKLPRDAAVGMDGLQDYLGHLAESVPAHVPSDLDETAVEAAAARYPELYRVRRGPGGIVILPGELRPKTDCFNRDYPDDVADYIGRVTEAYVRERYRKDRDRHA